MMIKINETYSIKADAMNYMLMQKRINKKTGKLYFDCLGYFNTIVGLGKFYVEHIAKDLPETLEKLISEIEKAKSEIIEACRRHNNDNRYT